MKKMIMILCGAIVASCGPSAEEKAFLKIQKELRKKQKCIECEIREMAKGYDSTMAHIICSVELANDKEE